MFFGMPEPDPKQYLDYLDKEMTIMGILSTFCIAAASLVIDRVASAEDGKDSLFLKLGQQHFASVLIGSVFLILAGLCFYLQRSRLAHFYGCISMSVVQADLHEWNTSRWLEEAYSWRTWLRYRAGFTFLMLTGVAYTYALYRTVYPGARALTLLFVLLCVGIIGEAVRRHLIISAYGDESNPYEAFRAQGSGVFQLLKDLRSRKEF
jgi:hypothetical protein